jgi:hypothetical protein
MRVAARLLFAGMGATTGASGRGRREALSNLTIAPGVTAESTLQLPVLTPVGAGADSAESRSVVGEGLAVCCFGVVVSLLCCCNIVWWLVVNYTFKFS